MNPHTKNNTNTLYTVNWYLHSHAYPLRMDYATQTNTNLTVRLAMQCLHIFKKLQLSLNPPRARLPKLSPDTTAMVPYMILGVP